SNRTGSARKRGSREAKGPQRNPFAAPAGRAQPPAKRGATATPSSSGERHHTRGGRSHTIKKQPRTDGRRTGPGVEDADQATKYEPSNQAQGHRPDGGKRSSAATSHQVPNTSASGGARDDVDDGRGSGRSAEARADRRSAPRP